MELLPMHQYHDEKETIARCRTEHTGQEKRLSENCSINYGNWSKLSRPLVGLLSFPRYGNTWTRHLLELATGTYTGSLGNAGGLFHKGLKAEFDDPQLGRALVYKSHHYTELFKSGILLIKNPHDSLISWHIFKLSGFMGNPSLEVFRNSTVWIDFVKLNYVKWSKLIATSLESGMPIIIVRYEDLVHNSLRQLDRMLQFMNMTLKPERVECINTDLEGVFHRRHPDKFHFDPYP
ncbi:sialate:O-sulfotransferase 1-like [Saccoglossus kowalevskii]|uniref:WSC domain-containing protein 2-like n=1 Tax=Saccoglossus kowalevskii TaxID=10224 RepID=A0ABM0MFK8_SACKO|nr:PREDICTED: WSC domain-containing protein 2-like [Saccoglossus kowalevskii]